MLIFIWRIAMDIQCAVVFCLTENRGSFFFDRFAPVSAENDEGWGGWFIEPSGDRATYSKGHPKAKGGGAGLDPAPAPPPNLTLEGRPQR